MSQEKFPGSRYLPGTGTLLAAPTRPPFILPPTQPLEAGDTAPVLQWRQEELV